MRTTIDLPDTLHRQLTSIARDSQKSMSEMASLLIARGLHSTTSPSIGKDPQTGLPTYDFGRSITTEDVRSLEDEL